LTFRVYEEQLNVCINKTLYNINTKVIHIHSLHCSIVSIHYYNDFEFLTETVTVYIHLAATLFIDQ